MVVDQFSSMVTMTSCLMTQPSSSAMMAAVSKSITSEGSHDAVLHQGLDHLGAGLLHPAGQLAHGDLVGDLHLHRALRAISLLKAAHLAGLLLLTALGGLALLLLAVAALLLDLLLALTLLHPLGALGARSSRCWS